ncbi:ATP-dependent DNA ligase [Candidatus Woesearchaeota archaeon]|mgnify:CR=1 FL=1|jgi:DNA ligase 1|nr:ATP-dependent DNA ligase [Candidatus Woesearchaeota archaeon]
MRYVELAELYNRLADTSKRLEKTDIIADFLKNTKKEDLENVVCLLNGRVFPLWDSRKIGFSSRLLIKAISSATGSSVDNIEKELNKLGDLGDVAELEISRKSQKTLFSETLTIKKVADNIRRLSDMEGSGSVDRKIGLVAELITNSNGTEAKYISRTVLEVLRVGIADGIIKDAIAKAFDQEIKTVDEAFDILADHGEVALLANENKLGDVKLKPGRPLKLMLAVLSKSIEEGFSAVGTPAALEYKYDGFRMQIHNDGKKISLFTRGMEDVTKQFPDVVKAVSKIKGKNFIVDCEVVGYEPKTGKYLPFQKISQRIRRKYDTEEMAKQFPVEINAFDLIYYEGKKLLSNRFEDRRELLKKIIKEIPREIVLSKLLITDDDKKVQKFFKESVKSGHEGVMFKSLGAPYKPGRYVGYIAKLKEVMDALDLVVVKAEWGEGKRASWLTSYTVACKDGDNFLEVGKVSTGLKEKFEEGELDNFENMTNELKKIVVSQKGNAVMVKPQIVVEVSYEEIQKSPTYASGYALRFPRILQVRYDKPLNEISTIGNVEELYKSQNK